MRRYFTLELRAITNDAPRAAIDAVIREALLAIRRLELGEIDIQFALGDEVKVNEHGFAVPLPAFPEII